MSTKEHSIIKFQGDNNSEQLDKLTIEEPLQISIASPLIKNNTGIKNIAITMRTPGNDAVLAIGFLYGEGLITEREELATITEDDNKVCLHLTELNAKLSKLDRHFYTSSSCGICGKASIDSIQVTKGIPPALKSFTATAALIKRLPLLARPAQQVFQQTGGIHAATLFDFTGNIVVQYEDVGRHNALDKVVGSGFLDRSLPFDAHILLLSGRASFELLQKSIMAGIQMVVAMGAPSSLAVKLAEEYDVTLIGFLKKDSFNVYTGKQRVSR